MNNRSNEKTDMEKYTDVAQDITYYAACVEVGLGYFTLICFLLKLSCCTKGTSCTYLFCGSMRNGFCLCCCHSETYVENFLKVIYPFVMLDAVFIVVVAPISSIHPFIIGCVEGYILTLARVAAYLLTLGLLFIFRYYKVKIEKNSLDDKQVRSDLLNLGHVLVQTGLGILSTSSCFATFIEMGLTEEKSIRYSYLVATIIIAIFTLVGYYASIYELHAITSGRNTKVCNEFTGHATFWFLLFGNIVLLVLNTIILAKDEKLEFRYAGFSMLLNIGSIVYDVGSYIITGKFCQHGPLWKKVWDGVCNRYSIMK